MTDQTQSTTPPAAGSPPPGGPPAGDPGSTATSAARPEWLPEPYWDPKANAINTDEFGKHYQEVAASHAKLAERAAAIPAKPEEYKPEVKLPDTVKVPEGVKFEPAKDPRLPEFLKFAHAQGMTNEEVNRWIAWDAQNQIAEFEATQQATATRAVEEDKKLGEKAKERRTAVQTWADSLKEKGFTAAEINDLKLMSAFASGVTTLEKLMEKINGSVPGHQPELKSNVQQPKLLKDILYPDQQKAS